MILVIVAMETVAPDGLIVFEAADEILDRVQVIAILRIVDGIGLRNAKNTTVLDVGWRNQADAIQLPLPQLNEVGVRNRPQPVTLGTEILQPQATFGRIRHHVRTPVFEVLNSSHLDLGIVNINPIVRKQLGFVNDQAHGEKIAVFQFLRGLHDLCGGGGGSSFLINSVIGMLEIKSVP